ncbi:transcriptional regulator [Natronococcus sp. A-GB1]|uniref:RAD55 family ATPase n=1 Tax=Natronococcus sp. A-GB1 TaxID=3037648 RepID=UPI00241DDACB|nr:transcriptional regulator [Natronococcus sp. A-GB1]MDG5759503.1 transcriptional regulator [Natronococcus sp. A-GB1]
MVDRLRTGIDALDRRLEGGLPRGALVAYTAEPASQSERLLYELMAACETRYLSTERSIRAVRSSLEAAPATVSETQVERLSAKRLEDATRTVADLSEERLLIVDTADRLERSDPDDYVAFLNELKETLLEIDGVAVLHCLRGTEPSNRIRTLHAADAVFELHTDRVGGRLETTLAIPKFRYDGQPVEAITLELTDGVAIDTSRDIA